jgi:hypothetical protein
MNGPIPNGGAAAILTVPGPLATAPPDPIISAHGLVKSRKRVADHGEVFTPAWMVEDMLNLVKDESVRIDARFLEPACGSGNFLVAVLSRKLTSVESWHGKSDFEKRHYALLALMNIYGIELLADNARECRFTLSATFTEFLGIETDEVWCRAASAVVEANIVQGDALTMNAANGEPITLPEWGYLGKGKYQRRDFQYENLAQRASISGTLFEQLDEHEVFRPTKTYLPMSVQEIAQ